MKFSFKLALSRKTNKETTTKGAGVTIQPHFIENVEKGVPYRITGSNIEQIIAALRGDYSDRSLVELFESVAEIFAPIDLIASCVISGEPVFRRIKSDEIVYDNPNLNKLIDNINPLQTFKQAWYEAMCYEMVTGKSYFFKNKPKSLTAGRYENIVSQSVLPSDRITIDTPEKVKLFKSTRLDQIINKYILDKGTQDEQEFLVNDVMYRKFPSLKWSAKKIEGRSILLSAERAIRNLIAVYEARGIIYLKRGAMGMWVSKKSDHSGLVSLNPQEKKALREEQDKDYGITANKHTIGISDAPIAFEKSSMSIQEMMPFEETLADAAVIYGVLGVPFELAPKMKGETYANQITAGKGLYQNKAIPYSKDWCSSFTKFWEIDKDGFYFDMLYDKLPILQDDKKELATTDLQNNQTWLRQFTNGIITLNQWIVNSGGEEITGNAMYNKSVYNMDETELAKVKEILNLQKPSNNVDSKPNT